VHLHDWSKPFLLTRCVVCDFHVVRRLVALRPANGLPRHLGSLFVLLDESTLGLQGAYPEKIALCRDVDVATLRHAPLVSVANVSIVEAEDAASFFASFLLEDRKETAVHTSSFGDALELARPRGADRMTGGRLGAHSAHPELPAIFGIAPKWHFASCDRVADGHVQ
jgi:hypothetical protein